MSEKKYLDDNGVLYLGQKISTKLETKVDKEDGKGLSTNDYTTTEKEKLAGIATNANNYSLPIANTSRLGGIKAGKDVTINTSTGVLNVDRVTGLSYNSTTKQISVASVANGESITGTVLNIHEGYSTTAEMNTAITTAVNQAVSSAVIYKGTVASYSNLPTDAEVGHLYNVTDTGKNYVWNGTEWDDQGGTVDLSNYVEESDLVAITNAEIDAIFA